MQLRLALLVPCLFLHAQTPIDDPDALARKLFPDRDHMHDLRLMDVAAHLRLAKGSKMADVGCGTGEVALIWSRAVGPEGHVYAEDIAKRPIEAARKLMKKHQARNVTVIQGSAKDPKLPAELDAIYLLDVYHELTEYPDMLSAFARALKSGGRIAIVDPVPRKTASRGRKVQMKNHVLHPDLAEADLKKAGWTIVHRDDRFQDNPDSEGVQWLLVAERPK